MKKILLTLALFLFLNASHLDAQRLVLGLRGTNLFTVNPDAGDARTYTSFMTLSPALNESYRFETSNGSVRYLRFTSVNESITAGGDDGWLERLDVYFRYYHKEKWFIQYDGYGPEGTNLKLNTQESSTEDFDGAQTYETGNFFDFSTKNSLIYGKYVGTPKFGQLYYLAGVSRAKARVYSGFGDNEQNIFSSRIGGGIRYKSLMFEVFFETSLSPIKTSSETYENGYFNPDGSKVTETSPGYDFGRYKWLDISITMDLISVPIRSRKRAKEVEEIKNSW